MDSSKLHVYHYSEEMSGPEGLSGAVWKELAKEYERRQIYEQLADRRADEQQKVQMQQQLDIMKMLHPSEFGMRAAGSDASSIHGPAPPSLGSCGFTSDGYEGMGMMRESARAGDRYAGGDQSRSNAGMNWDATGRLRGSPDLSVPSNGHDEWLLSATASPYDTKSHHDGDHTELMSTDTYFSSTRSTKLPPGALAGIRVEPPEIHWPQSEAVRHIIEEEDEQDAQMFALQKTMSRTADDTESASTYKAPIVVGNISTGMTRRDPADSDSHYADSDANDGLWSAPSASTIRRELELSGSRQTKKNEGPMSATLRLFEQRRRQAAAERATQLRGYRSGPSSKDDEINRSTGGSRNADTAEDHATSREKKRASEEKVISRIERAVDLGLRLRRMTRPSPQDEFDHCDDHYY